MVTDHVDVSPVMLEVLAEKITASGTTNAEVCHAGFLTYERSGAPVDVGYSRYALHQSAVPLRSHGSLSMNRALMAAGLVDRVQVTIFPVITGRTGTDRVFAGAADFDLELPAHRTLDRDIHELVYRPTVHPGLR